MLVLLLLATQGDLIPELIDRLGHDDIEAREIASILLGQAGQLAVPALLRALGSSDPEIRARAAEILRRQASGAPLGSLRLSLGESAQDSKGVLKVRLRATNTGTVPMLVHVPGLMVVGLSISNRPCDQFTVLQPNAKLDVELEGTPITQVGKLTPLYCGVSSGSPASRPIKVFKLRNQDPTEVARILHEVFKPEPSFKSLLVEVAVDLRTRSIVVRALEDHLNISGELIEKLDADPIDPGKK